MATPVQRQYWLLKEEHPDAILFFQLGDFYELFYEDAQVVSRVTGIQLTARHKGTDNEMTMCGFPMRAHEEYLQQLVTAGFKVAIADQVTNSDGSIKRAISRVITAGTDDTTLNSDEARYVLSLVQVQKTWAIAYADVTTGEFRTASFQDLPAAVQEILRISPSEILLPTHLYEQPELCEPFNKSVITPQKTFQGTDVTTTVLDQYDLSDPQALGLYDFTGTIEASAYVLRYLNRTQKVSLKHLEKPLPYQPDGGLFLDALTLQHLEVFQPMYSSADKRGTLLSVFAKAKTGPGGRMLRQWLLRPLTDIDQIKKRHAGVLTLFQDTNRLLALRDVLSQIYDLERLLSRLSTGRTNARELQQLGKSLQQLPNLRELLLELGDTFHNAAKVLQGLDLIANKIVDSLQEHPPLELLNGGIIADGIDAEVDQLRQLSTNADAWLAKYLQQQKEATGISTIRIKFSRTFGYTLEVSKAYSEKAPDHWVRRQTLVNAERYVTPELETFAEEVQTAGAKLSEREYSLFQALRNAVLPHMPTIYKAAKTIAQIDVLGVFAITAQDQNWIEPTIVPDTVELSIIGGRHPVVESLSPEPFIQNNVQLSGDKNRLGLITGPNMAGKSTYLRQCALMVLLCQSGSFVPAAKAKMGIFHRMYTRVGASDNLSAGQSTFYLEMSETARILHQAQQNTFVILDEIGRGTSTFDGMSLAWAITEELHNRPQVLTLFATHYHELVDLVEGLSNAANFHVSVAQNNDGIVFLRQIKPGGVSDSFGIEVAKLAGVPPTVVQRAREVLEKLESQQIAETNQPSLFAKKAAPKPAPQQKHPVVVKLQKIDPDTLTPRKALELIYELSTLKDE